MLTTAPKNRPSAPEGPPSTKTFSASKLTIFLLLATCFTANATGLLQNNITFSGKKVNIESVFAAIKKQTGYVFMYTREQIKTARPVNIEAENMPLTSFLQLLFSNQPFDYQVKGQNIFLKEKSKTTAPPVPVIFQLQDTLVVRGRIVYENNEAVAASILIKGSSRGTATASDGSFVLDGVTANATLLISGTGIETREYKLNGNGNIGSISVNRKVDNMNAVIVNMGYYTTNKLTSTGSVGKVNSKEIEKQPVNNPLLALQGRVPGVVITPVSGLAGADVKLEIRGKNFISSGSQPLYVVDGVPFNSQAVTQQGTTSTAVITGTNLQSPFTSINPSDIEKIEILKDADATAIYGSRGGNGVVLITTKRGFGQKTKLDVNVFTGTGTVAKKLDLLNTTDYLDIRRKAFKNDNIQPTPFNAPDLVSWDAGKYTDWQEELIGGTAKILNAEAAVSGGNESTNFIFRTSYRKDGTVFPDDYNMKRTTAFLKVDHNARKLSISVSANYAYTDNHQIAFDPTNDIYTAPNYPIYDQNGKFNWGGNIQNVMARISPIKSLSRNLIGRILAQYAFTEKLSARISAGYNLMSADEVSTTRSSAINPAMGFKGSARFSTGSNTGFIIEPQLNYETDILTGRLQILAGSTFQSNKDKSTMINAMDYSDDDMLEVLSAAGDYFARSNQKEYRYQSVFSRLNYSIANTYIINATFRRDGSSRFGKNNRFGNFGAIGAGWVFSREHFAADWTPVLSYGKLRGSYGVTGSDQINDYEYAGTWMEVPTAYQGISGYRPEKLPNPDLQWESVKKAELGLELGFFANRLNLSIGHYRNLAGNQLLMYPMPTTTGFNFMTRNFDAKVRNSGWEIQVNSINISRNNNDFEWRTSFNITLPKNKLVALDGIENSEFRYSYEVGKSLNLFRGYKLLNIDPQTGMARFEDVDKDGFITYEKDRQTIGTTDPVFYGGMQNEIRWKQFSIDFHFHFSSGKAGNYLRNQIVGEMYNIPGYAANRIWKQEGDITATPGGSTSFLSPRYMNFRNYLFSSGNFANNSFLRLKNVSISYLLPKTWTEKISISMCRIYLNAQNLFTVTSTPSLDPETGWQNLPQLRVITAGLQIQL